MRFFKPALAVDRELELVPPSLDLIDDFLLSQPELPSDQISVWTRHQLQELIRLCPSGFDPGDPLFERWPAYYFWMRRRRTSESEPSIVGTLAFRVSSNKQIDLYYGHIGYSVFPAARGNRYAERATRLILPLAHKHGFREIWITANPDNTASRRTCERLGAELVETVNVPTTTRLYARGDRQKCRYRLAVGSISS